MLIDYISSMKNIISLCDQFRDRVLDIFFSQGQVEESIEPDFISARMYKNCFEPIKGCVELCRILKPHLPLFEYEFYDSASSLEKPRDTRNLNDFMHYIEGVRLGFSFASKELEVFSSSFSNEEKERMNEAIHTFIERCYYSSVAMSVSATESRLLKLMCLTSPALEQQELKKNTLGQLIREYVDNRDKYKNVVPKRHEPLLQLCNTYRIFSVHPKKQQIKSGEANSILNLAIEFLTDNDTKPEAVKVRISSY